MRAPVHPKEAERLQAVRGTGLVGGRPDALQETVIELASDICGTPIAAVSLVDADRLWFTAIRGLDFRETSRDAAFCAHTILGDVPLIVGDATQDPRFSDNSLVTGAPAIRFYVGVPIKTVDHLPVGTLCVMDTTPREISRQKIENLKTLAALVATQLQSSGPKALLQIGEVSRFLTSIVDSSGDAIISKDLNGIIRSWNSGAERIYGYSAEEMVGKSISMLIPEELCQENERLMAQITRGEPCNNFETVRIAKDGRRLNVSVTLSPLQDSLGRIIGFWKVVRDITEQVETKAQLRDTAAHAERLAEIARRTSNAVIITDAQGRITWANERFTKITGYTLEEALGNVPGRLLRSDKTDPKAAETMRAAVRGGVGCRVEIINRGKHGREYVLDIEMHPLHDAAGTLTGFMAIESDITEKAVAKAELHQAAVRSERLAEIARRTTDAVIITDAQGRITWTNEGFTRITGYTLEEALGKVPGHLLQFEKTDPAAVEILRSAVSKGVGCRVEILNRGKDGREYVLDLELQPLHDATGILTGFMAIESDITEQTRTRLELENSRLELMDFAENASVGLQWIDRDGIIVWANKAELELLGYTPEEFIGQPISRFHADSTVICDVLARLARRERLIGYEARLLAKDGSKKIVSIYSSVYEQGGELKHTRCFTIDITARKEAEDRLKESRKVVERQNTELSVMAERAHRVVDDVSHEFRTPLAVIKEFASIIADGLAGPVSDKQAQYLRIVSGAVVDLNHMVEDLLDSSKLRAGILRVDRRAHRVDRIFETGRAALASKASTRSIVIKERIEEGLPALFADEEKVRRVISNLTTNAIKFSPEGGTIVLSAATAARSGEIIISVTDHGPGLSSSDIERLFGRFQQASTARSVAAKGFGLGLSIAQELSWLNLGKLSVTSEKGKGATFSFTLPTDDCVSVLEHYFESIVASDRPEDQLALLRVVAQAPTALDETQEFLASATYPTDLIMPALQDEDDGMEQEYAAQAWWILGRTRSVESWIARLYEARRSQSLENTIRLAPLFVDVCGMWRLPENASEARVDVIEAVTQENLRDAKNPNH